MSKQNRTEQLSYQAHTAQSSGSVRTKIGFRKQSWIEANWQLSAITYIYRVIQYLQPSKHSVSISTISSNILLLI